MTAQRKIQRKSTVKKVKRAAKRHSKKISADEVADLTEVEQCAFELMNFMIKNKYPVRIGIAAMRSLILLQEVQKIGDGLVLGRI